MDIYTIGKINKLEKIQLELNGYLMPKALFIVDNALQNVNNKKPVKININEYIIKGV